MDFSKLLLKKPYIVCDIDNTICYTTRKWGNECCRKMDWFKTKVDWAIGRGYEIDVDNAKFDERPMSSMSKWLNLNENQTATYHKSYNGDKTFYDNIELTYIGKALKGYDKNKIVFISHTAENSDNLDSKSKLIAREYGKDYDVHFVKLTTHKSEFINRLSFKDGTPYMDMDLMIDDNLSVIKEVNRNVNGCFKFIIPEYGYNGSFQGDCIYV